MRSATSALLARLVKVKEVRGPIARWTALCPAHTDHKPSLQVTEGDHKLLLHCWGNGCSEGDICRAIGFPERALCWEGDFSGIAGGHNRRASANGRRPVVSTNRLVVLKEPTVSQERPARSRPAAGLGELTAEHLYSWEDGSPAGLVRRFQRPDPEHRKGYRKECIPYHRHGQSWVKGKGNGFPLYRLPDLGDAPQVVFVEGENVADALALCGLVATTAQGGTKAELPDLTPLAGKQVAILPDEDDEGRLYGERVLEALKVVGAAAWIAHLPPHARQFAGYDAANYLEEEGGQEAGYAALLTSLVPPPPTLRFKLLSLKELLALKSPRWQIEQFIQERGFYLLYGETSHGKTFVGMSMLLHIAASLPWCGRKVDSDGITVLINADGGLGIRDRLAAWQQANEADLNDYPLFTLNDVLPLGSPGAIIDFCSALEDLQQKTGRKIGSVMADTYSRCIPGMDENKQGESSLVVRHIDTLREKFECSFGAIHHTDGTGLKPRGSSVLLNACDSAWRVTRDRNSIAVQCAKQRNGTDNQPGLAFLLKPVADTGQVVLWHEGATDPLTERVRCESAVAIAIETEPGRSAKELVEATGFSQQRVSEALRSLHKQRLIRRTTDTPMRFYYREEA